MKTSSTFSILIWINASRAKNNEAEIFARITVNQKRANISLKRKININSWDKNKSKAKGNSQNARLLSQTYVKVNALTTLLTIPNVGIETSIGKKSTFQFDVTASFWKSIRGKPDQFYLFIPEYRYHFKEKYNGFYVGAHVGFSLFNIVKWNHISKNEYQKGFGYVMGATFGYQIKIDNRFLLDCFLGAGNSQGFYKGYKLGTNIRYDGATNYNKSGEWLPYRGGVMVSYRIK